MEQYDYISEINTKLIPNSNPKYTVLDLFAGCGGLSLGFEAAGFRSFGIEKDPDCCDTYNKNLKGKCIKHFLTTESEVSSSVDIVIGGPPCQPFSVRGKQNGLNDSRNGFPIFINTISQLKPSLWMFENVRGLLYRNKWYLDQVVSSLEKLGYTVDINIMNAVDFGVPQNRERIIVIGHKKAFEIPEKHHRKINAGEALNDMSGKYFDKSKVLTPKMDVYIEKYEKASKCIMPRDLHLDRPARTLTCRNLAGSTSDMHRIKLPDGKRRRITTREAARLQSFPDWFEFQGSETSVFNQIGNAVPPYFAFQLAKKVISYLEKYSDKTEMAKPIKFTSTISITD